MGRVGSDTRRWRQRSYDTVLAVMPEQSLFQHTSAQVYKKHWERLSHALTSDVQHDCFWYLVIREYESLLPMCMTSICRVYMMVCQME